MVEMCTEMSDCCWLPCDESSVSSESLRSGLSRPDMSVLHLAAALNYYKLIQCLLKWRNENPSLVLELEIDAFSCDDNESTPLMWSCAKGHLEAALLLYHWNRAAINLCNKLGDSPLQLARRRGHQKLVQEIERLEAKHTVSQASATETSAGRRTRKASLDAHCMYNKSAKSPSPATVKRGSACLQHGLLAFPKLVKCFSADSSLLLHKSKV